MSLVLFLMNTYKYFKKFSVLYNNMVNMNIYNLYNQKLYRVLSNI